MVDCHYRKHRPSIEMIGPEMLFICASVRTDEMKNADYRLMLLCFGAVGLWALLYPEGVLGCTGTLHGDLKPIFVFPIRQARSSAPVAIHRRNGLALLLRSEVQLRTLYKEEVRG